MGRLIIFGYLILTTPLLAQDTNELSRAMCSKFIEVKQSNLRQSWRSKKMMGTYLTHPPRRHRSERIGIKNRVVFVNVWQIGLWLDRCGTEVSRHRLAGFWSNSVHPRWRQVLSEFPDVKAVTLRLHEVEHKANSRRVKRGREKVVRYASITLTRNALKTLKTNSKGS